MKGETFLKCQRLSSRMMQNPCFRGIITVAKWFPVVFITAIVGWSYFAYVKELCIYEIQSVPEKTLYLIFYHIFFILFVWSYYQCIFTTGGKIPSRFYLSSHQLAEIEPVNLNKDYEGVKKLLRNYAANLPVSTRDYSGDVRFCEKCDLIKPDRAHHCSVCERCILKMDHHCPWVNNCVCFNNYKYFILFLGYAVVYCLFVALTDLQYFIKFWKDELTKQGNPFHILFLFFVSAMFSISLVTLLSYHIYLTCKNQTTIESYRSPVFAGGSDKNGFNLGSMGNFRQVFGDNWLLWFLPVFTSKGDGSEYPVTSSRNLAYAPTTTTSSNGADPPPSQQQYQAASQINLNMQQQINNHDRPLSNSQPHSNGVNLPNYGALPHNSVGRGYSFPMRQPDEDQRDLLESQPSRSWSDMEVGGGETNLIALDSSSPQQHYQPRLITLNEQL